MKPWTPPPAAAADIMIFNCLVRHVGATTAPEGAGGPGLVFVELVDPAADDGDVAPAEVTEEPDSGGLPLLVDAHEASDSTPSVSTPTARNRAVEDATATIPSPATTQ